MSQKYEEKETQFIIHPSPSPLIRSKNLKNIFTNLERWLGHKQLVFLNQAPMLWTVKSFDVEVEGKKNPQPGESSDVIAEFASCWWGNQTTPLLHSESTKCHKM